MDISGVDVDFLNDEEIFELCSGIVDTDYEKINIAAANINVHAINEDKVEEYYESLLYSSDNIDIDIKKLTDEQVLSLNTGIVDTDSQELTLINGHKIDVDSLTEEEILTLYDDYTDINTEEYIAALYSIGVKSCTALYTEITKDANYAGLACELSDGRTVLFPLTCYKSSYSGYCSELYSAEKNVYSGTGYCYIYLEGDLSYSSTVKGKIACSNPWTYVFGSTGSGSYRYWRLK